MLNTVAEAPRARVRTPGKYIVLVCACVLAVVASGFAVIRQTSILDLTTPGADTLRATNKQQYLPLSEFLVDLAPDRMGRKTYLKLSALLVLPSNDDDALIEVIEQRKPAIMERTTFFLRQLRPEDFASSEGMERLKTELARRINIEISPQRVDAVVIDDLVIQ